MTGLEGIRVMRGPHWDQGDTDGGEGHLGTVTRSLRNGLLHVAWDKGQESTCKAGTDGKFDLRVFDSAPAGVRHPNTTCAGCGETNIFGCLWRCEDCSHCDMCPLCYGDDKHDIRHRFLRIDHYKSEGEAVKKRKVSVRMRTMGTFPGAKVTRGRDWAWGNQDGGPGSVGEVLAFENVAPDSSRNLVRVQWRGGKINSYRLGFRGNVDLTCVEEDVGPFYYRDHLPWLDASKLPYPLAPEDAFTSPTPPSPTIPPSTDRTTIATTLSATATTSSPDTVPTTATSSSATSSSNRSVPPPPLPLRDSKPGELDSQISQPSDSAQQTQPLPPPSPPSTITPTTFPSQDDDGFVASGGNSVREITQAEQEAVEKEGWEVEEEEEMAEKLVVGDEVVVGVNENTLRDLQDDYGGVSEKMIKMVSQKGRVTEVNTGVMVRFGSTVYMFNPLALIKVPSLKEGDVIRIRRDVSQVKLLNKRIAWNQQIADTCGKVGRVQTVHKDDTVTVTLGHYQTFRFSSACCVPSPGATPNPLGSLVQARRAAVAGSEPSTGGHAYPGKAVDGRPSPGRKLGVLAGTSPADMQTGILKMTELLAGSGSDSDGDSSDPLLKLLFSLIARGDTAAVQAMVRANWSLLTKTEQTLTPLMYACYEGQRDVVTSLLDIGADVNTVGGKGRTPLYVAIDSRKEDVAMLLLDRGANPNVKTERGHRTPLHAAVHQNFPQLAQVLICRGADVNAKDREQDTPMFDAIEIGQGHEALVEVLLQADTLNHQELNRRGFNMLQLACLRGNARSVELILSSEKHPGVDDLLLGEYSALHIAANNDHMECVGIMVLIGGATIDIPDGRRSLTPLHLACRMRQFNAAEALIGLGAGVNVTDANGNTPLHLAMGKRLETDTDDNDVSYGTAVEQRTRLACLLIGSGAVLDVTDEEGRSPLSYGFREVQINVEERIRNIGLNRPLLAAASGSNIIPVPPSIGPQHATIRTNNTAATTTTESAVSYKRQDSDHLNALLRGASIQCASCDAMSDVTLQPCGHKVVCRTCCDVIAYCPRCGTEVDEREPDNTDDQEEEDRQTNEKETQKDVREGVSEKEKQEKEEMEKRNEKLEAEVEEKEENETQKIVKEGRSEKEKWKRVEGENSDEKEEAEEEEEILKTFD
ncbi:uncharacterized protein LOC143287544 isoform X2 [Babylonia areolata]|uniref:uncharacterized protein LOC143287544 isoform X2 n=1 Tax=Babylonia areolata TaxID=304850 RepID=UPI003FD6B18E